MNGESIRGSTTIVGGRDVIIMHKGKGLVKENETVDAHTRICAELRIYVQAAAVLSINKTASSLKDCVRRCCFVVLIPPLVRVIKT